MLTDCPKGTLRVNGIHFTQQGSWSALEIKTMLARKELFRAHSFEFTCAQNAIDHRLTKPKHPWAKLRE